MSPSAARRAKPSAKGAARPPPRPFVVHHLAPPHEVLGEEDSRRILGELGTPPERLPKILVSDPGLQTDPKYTAMKEAGEKLVGRLVRVRRPSATAGQAIAYRLIVSPAGGE